ncbi:hypothetical protein [Pedobacter insulae]|uniref:Uncharacterized protein n=1 Tax=Pedobacter insulae TaxID=414048 RepID=A0A1I2ZKG4_9SPHI|nr:hypothetical protein [Pedobacter insulae]SFH38200.1 hypothetical protein SAMN04489864_11095 [Pedobacter insulae]
MVKTSTSPNSVNFSKQATDKQTAEPAKTQDEMFYDNIKPKLDQLMVEPSNETIERILAYAKKK